MRVVHIIKIVLVAGAERHLLALLPGLRERDVDARIIVLVEPDKPMDDFAAACAERDIPAERIVIRGNLDPTLPRKLYHAVKAHQPDIVHTHLLHADLYGIPTARLLGAKVISSRHNDNTFRRRFPYKQINWGLWRMTHAGIAISDAIRRFCIEVEGAPSARTYTVHYGLLEAQMQAVEGTLRAELGLPEGVLLVGSVCRLIEQKGLTYGLQAFARIAEKHPNAHYVIAGTGNLHEELEAEAGSLDLQHRVNFLGWRDDTANVMASLDVFLMPSLWEGFGLVMLEAMAQRTPIIASNVSAIPEVVVHNETGLLVQPRDVDGLAHALDALLSDHEGSAKMGDAGRMRLEQFFRADQMAQKTKSVYTRVAGEK